MTKFRILVSQTAVSQLSLLNSKQKKRVKDTLLKLEDNPFRGRSGVDIKKLVTPDDPPLFRLRIGDYRAFYKIEQGRKVNVIAIGHKEHHDLFIQGKKVNL